VGRDLRAAWPGQAMSGAYGFTAIQALTECCCSALLLKYKADVACAIQLDSVRRFHGNRLSATSSLRVYVSKKRSGDVSVIDAGSMLLQVINEDYMRPGTGFGMHSHCEMGIITDVLERALAHHDGTGTGSVIHQDHVQRMSAGVGISHREYNPSPTASVHFLQISVVSGQKGLTPIYEQRAFARAKSRRRWRLIAARDGRDGAVAGH
jgi:Pirin